MKSDRINRIVRIKRPSAEERIAEVEKKIFTPLNFEEQHSVFNWGPKSRKSCLPCEMLAQ